MTTSKKSRTVNEQYDNVRHVHICTLWPEPATENFNKNNLKIINSHLQSDYDHLFTKKC